MPAVRQFADLTNIEDLPMPGPRSSAVMIGAGFSKALNPALPNWGSLINSVRKNLSGKPKALAKGADIMVEAYRLSRRFSNRVPNALPTTFQKAVTKVFTAIPQNGTYVARLDALAAGLSAFLSVLRCRVVIDLNYDNSVELALTAAKRPFVISIGSEARWPENPPFDAIRVWKIHGTLDQPSTIVLSPNEYQRLYEVNAISAELARLGQRTDTLWSIGVGLDDDDVWSYVCSQNDELQVVALWMVGDKESEAKLDDWYTIVTSEEVKPLVLRSNYEDVNGTPRLAACLSELAQEIANRASQAEPPSTYAGPSVERFDEEYTSTFEVGHDITPVIDRYRLDYIAAYEHFLSYGADGRFGPRWCPTVDKTKHATALDAAGQEGLACDFMEVVKRAEDACQEAKLRRKTDSILLCSAAQRATVHVVELAELLGITVRMEIDWKGIDFKRDEKHLPRRRIGIDQSVLVGSNPFDMQTHHLSNPMHVYKTKTPILLVAPLIDDYFVKPPDVRENAKLLTEDEWEAAVVSLYRWASPALWLGKKWFKPLAIPPLYPWGFRLMDIRDLRRDNVNGVSKYWHLVDKRLPDRRQVCKGGGLRDRSRRVFEIGSRGALTIGEYDEFLAPAFKFT
jgi:hypothetical protein